MYLLILAFRHFVIISTLLLIVYQKTMYYDFVAQS